MSLLFWIWRKAPFPDALRWVFLWLTNQKFLIGVSAVVLDDQGRVLLFKHTYRGRFPWGLPGGWLARNEDPTQAITREVSEESGLRVRALRPINAARNDTFPGLYLNYLCCFEGGTFRPSAEVSEAAFFAPDDLPDLLPDNLRLIRETILLAKDPGKVSRVDPKETL